MEPFQDTQVKLKELEEIDDFKHIVSREDKNWPYATALSTEYAYQSAVLGGNSLIIVPVILLDWPGVVLTPKSTLYAEEAVELQDSNMANIYYK